MTDREIWEKTLADLQSKISAASFKTWFSETRLTRKSDDHFEISCPNQFAKVKIEGSYLETIRQTLGREAKISLTITEKKESGKPTAGQALGPLFKTFEAGGEAKGWERSGPKHLSNLSPHYTLENFIVGSHNRLAFAMAAAVAKSPGANANNPFFLYAAVGLGKTHLVQAIGNEVIKNHPNLPVLYTTSENFTNELIESIQRRTQNSFRKKFRDVGVLIIDDVQFIAGRESTQEEFFHTFNALFLAQKQIVITSDRNPREIARLEERLTSRFGGGIMADIQNPDLDTRLAILQSKTRHLNLEIAPAILELLATRIQTNIRELEGGLKQVVNLMLSQNGQIDLATVESLLGPRATLRHGELPNPRQVIAAVASYYAVREGDLLGPRRLQSLVKPRQLAMYLVRRLCQLPLMKVGELLGGKDHTTVMHAVGKIEKALGSDERLKQDIFNIQKRLEVFA